MTLAEKVGQLLWCGFDGLRPSAGFAGRIAAGEVGVTVLFKRNLGEIADVIALCAELHDLAPPGTPLLIAIDQEGGKVQRVREPATVWPPMRRVGERGDAELAEAVGRALGEELAAVGVDIDFAPVLDVDTNPANPVIGERAFAARPEDVIRLAGAFARGLTAAGVLACGKHFPGHGDTSVDSHFALPRVDHALERLRAVELAPFRALASLPMVMTAHVIFAALDDTRPATLSPAVIGGLLRGELGYGGIVVSDDLEMKAIADHYGVCEAAEQALVAGCDTLLICSREDQQQEVHEHLVRAAERGEALRRRVDEAAARVAAMKAGHRAPARLSAEAALAVLGRREHQELARRLA